MSDRKEKLDFKSIINASLLDCFFHFPHYFLMACVFVLPVVGLKYGLYNDDEFINYFINATSIEIYNICLFIVIISLVILFFIYLIALIIGIDSHEKNNKTNIFKTYKQAVLKISGYCWLQIYYIARICMWSLALIVPGLLRMYDLSLAGVIYILEGGSIDEAFDKSKKITHQYIFTFLICSTGVIAFVLAVDFVIIDFFDSLIVIAINSRKYLIAGIIDSVEIALVVFMAAFPLNFFYRYYKTVSAIQRED